MAHGSKLRRNKKVREKWENGYEESLTLRPLDGTVPNVKSAICKFCESFGREDNHDDEKNEEAGTSELPLRTTVEVRPVKRRKKTKKNQIWTKFRPDNIKKHHREHHPEKWTENLEVLSQKRSQPDKLVTFFSQSRLEAFFESRIAVDRPKKTFALDTDIVDILLGEMLCGSSSADERLADDRAMSVFTPQYEEKVNGSRVIVGYSCTISKSVEFEYVVSLVASGLSFNQGL